MGEEAPFQSSPQASEEKEALVPTKITVDEFRRLAEMLKPKTAIIMHPDDATDAHRQRCADANVQFSVSPQIRRGEMLVIDLAKIEEYELPAIRWNG